MKKEKKRKKINKIQEIKKWLFENEVSSWQNYIEMNNIHIIELEELIYKLAQSEEEVENLRFEIKLHLSNEKELKEILRTLEFRQDFELCIKVVEKLKTLLE